MPNVKSKVKPESGRIRFGLINSIKLFFSPGWIENEIKDLEQEYSKYFPQKNDSKLNRSASMIIHGKQTDKYKNLKITVIIITGFIILSVIWNYNLLDISNTVKYCGVAIITGYLLWWLLYYLLRFIDNLRLLPKRNDLITLLEKEKDKDDKYYKRCVKQSFFEEQESRNFNNDPVLSKIIDLLNSRRYNEVLMKTDKIAKGYKDFDLLYVWRSRALQELNNIKEAKETLKNGLKNSKRKYLLCNAFGELECYSLHNIKEAVYWWIQAIHCQESFFNTTKHPYPYLYLKYVSDGAGYKNFALIFDIIVKHVDKRLGLNFEYTTILVDITKKGTSKGIVKALYKTVEQTIKHYSLPAVIKENEELENKIKVTMLKQEDR